ncbi:MAG: phosphoribosylanthranilate isomerase [Alphaproteobacteria bacterium]|nr:phosphoribosylanthranilate isomerase [Alphaproteobacteria bacterium]MBL6939673.1 phosphoribosylanthranilate isomerase [Alphaproteobacteria bacterium]MBL7097005.1 phosphoribosylanthranilate isomerase [Alphaproteobacteria bacterium]
MAILVKICGITTADAADAVVRAGGDFAGLMFHPKSPRNVAPPQAMALAERMRGRVRLVAVMSDPADEALDAMIRAVKPDLVQLHGAETAQRVGAIRSRFGVPVMKVISVATADDLAGIAAYEDAADLLMFDAKAPAGATREGGHGTAFDWQILRGRQFLKPWLLAGGLNAENVARAICACEAPGVDVSSGVETAPGKKSPEMIAAFVSAARNAQYGAAA